jgi:hypothetical protein
MRKNMKIPRKKEKYRTTSYYTENHKDYQIGLNSLRSNQAEEMEVMIKNSVKRLVNGSIARFRGSSRRKEKTMTTACSRYTSCSIHGLEFTCKRLFFPIKQVRKKLIP